ncbi:MAG: transposase [Bacteroidetes bacterium]|nr:transposase [Bacteroidota bacterium]
MLSIVVGRCRELLQQACKENEGEMIEAHVSKRPCTSFYEGAPPPISVSRSVVLMKGRSSIKLLIEDKDLQEQYLWQHFRDRNIFCGKFTPHQG